MADDRDLLERIRALREAIAEDSGHLRRSEVEPTLTEGYARALELDAECLRLEQRIDRLTRDMSEGVSVPTRKLSGLLMRLHETEEQRADLRELLVPLREVVAAAA
ncbi:MAG TPA: hypothetical protein VGJ40_01310 [Gaiellaceae bacterium]